MTSSPSYYIEVIGPYDTTFVGPFTTVLHAASYLEAVDRSVFDTYIMNEAAFRASIDEFGPAPLYPPEGVVQ